jgi:hypothetical protein
MASKTASIPNPSPEPPSAVAAAAAAAASAASTSNLSPAPTTPQNQHQIHHQRRRRRESSDEFLTIGIGSLSSIVVGNGTGSSVGDATTCKTRAQSLESSTGDASDSKPRADSLEISTTTSKGSEGNITTSAAADSTTNNSLHAILSPLPSLNATLSPSGRRPFRKRKGSVDFSLLIDDNDLTTTTSTSNNSNNLPTLLPYLTTTTATVPVSSSLQLTTTTTTINQKNSRKRQNSDDTTGDSMSSVKILPSTDALPPMETLEDTASLLLLQSPTSLLINNSPIIGGTETSQLVDNNNNRSSRTSIAIHNNDIHKERGYSFGSSKTEGRGIDHLDMLGIEANQNASKLQKESISERSHKSHASHDDGSNATSHDDGTFNSQSHRFLLEAFMGDGTESLILNPSQRERLGSMDVAAALVRDRLGSFDAAAAATAIGKAFSSNSRDNSQPKENNDKSNAINRTYTTTNNYNSNNNNSGLRDRLSSIGGRRDRLESWGGMSDLSAAGLHDQNSDAVASGGTATAAALAATIYTSLANDVVSAAAAATAGMADGNESVSSFLANDESIPSKISVNHRDRLNSVASMSTTEPSVLFHITAGGSVSAGSLSAEAMALFGDQLADQLADLATSMEAITSSGGGRDHHLDDSEVSSAASPMIGAMSDIGMNLSTLGRPRSSSVSSLMNNINVDYDAVAAAVDAAEAAAVAMDLTSLTGRVEAETVVAGSSTLYPCKNRKKRSLPLARSKHQYKQQIHEQQSSLEDAEVLVDGVASSHREERDMEEIRARARAAAGYVPPSSSTEETTPSALPPKKRAKLFEASSSEIPPKTPSGARPSIVLSSNTKTPLTSNTGSFRATHDSIPYPATPASAAKGQPSQKWESMFDCLLMYVEEQKREETRGMSGTQKKEWEWDGNVPTTYKTKDGKALGRWVNNQRSAKSKGTLKEDRETRLVNSGLKWSVLMSSTWNDMLEELRVYIMDQEKEGKKWNGNGKTKRVAFFAAQGKKFLQSFENTPSSTYKLQDQNLQRQEAVGER